MERRPINKATNYTSLMLTGDLQGVNYIKDTTKKIPSFAFNFCCTIGSNRDNEANLMAPKPFPKSKDGSYWSDERIQFFNQEANFQKQKILRFLVGDKVVNKFRKEQMLRERYEEIMAKYDEMLNQLQREIDVEY